MKAKSYTYPYPRPSVTVDCVVFGLSDTHALQVLLVRRGDAPFRGCWALPGGFVEVRDDAGQGEDLETAARRELKEETGAEVGHLEQLYTYGTPGRDPRGRVISVAYLALVRAGEHIVTHGSDAADAGWMPVDAALQLKLAFDHQAILGMALTRLRTKVRYEPIGFGLLPETFTRGQLQAVYETILGRRLDGANFRKRIVSLGILSPVRGKTVRPPRGGPAAQLYRFDREAYINARSRGVHFEI